MMHQGPRAIRRYLRALPVIAGISLATLTLSYLGWLDHFEHAGLDAFNVLASPRDPTHVVLVGVTDDDYRRYFDETSPLNPDALARVIDAIAAGRPRVIAVDLDTSASAFARMPLRDDWPRIVWARDAVFERDRVAPVSVLGGRSPRSIDGSGIAAVPQDDDGVVRRAVRVFETDHTPVPSFAFQIVRTACDAGGAEFCNAAHASGGSGEAELRLNFAGERYNYSPLSIDHVVKVSRAEGWSTDSPLKDKIVLLGGFYRAARDSYVTPVGTMAGVQITAQAVESFVAGGIRPLNHALAFLFDMLAGLTVVFVQHRFRLSVALLLTLVAIPLLALVGSYMAFSTFAWWIDFAPVTIGVLIHELYHHAAEYQRLRAQGLRASPLG